MPSIQAVGEAMEAATARPASLAHSRQAATPPLPTATAPTARPAQPAMKRAALPVRAAVGGCFACFGPRLLATQAATGMMPALAHACMLHCSDLVCPHQAYACMTSLSSHQRASGPQAKQLSPCSVKIPRHAHAHNLSATLQACARPDTEGAPVQCALATPILAAAIPAPPGPAARHARRVGQSFSLAR